MRLLGKEKRQKILKSKGGKIVKRYNFYGRTVTRMLNSVSNILEITE